MVSELWAKAPLVLIRRFAPLSLGVFLGASILGAAAISGPAFITSTERASLQAELDRSSRWTAGLRLTQPATSFGPPPRTGALEELGTGGHAILERLTAESSGLGGPDTTYLGSTGTLASPTDEVLVRLVERSEARKHIEIQERSGEGLLIADETARQLGVAVGDRVTIAGGTGEADLRVAGTYRFLPFDRVRPYWAPFADSIYREPSADTYPPSFVFSTPGRFFALAEEIGDYGDVHWHIPLASTDLTLGEAKALDRELADLIDRVYADSSGFRDLIGDTIGSFRFFLSADTALPGVVRTAEERIETVTPAVGLLALAARGVALAILAALGFYLVKRRRTEVLTLVARGVAPARIGLRSGLEAAIALLLGVAFGVLVGGVVVSAAGPARGVHVAEALAAWPTVSVTLLVGVAVLMATVAGAAAREERAIGGIDHHRLPRTTVAATGAIAAAAGSAAYLLYLQPTSSSDPAGLVPTLMPVVLIMAAAVAGAALAKVLIGWLGSLVRNVADPVYLGLKRLAGAPGMVQVLIAATASAVAVMLYGMGVSASVEETAEAKARIFVGSDVSARLSANADVPDLPVRATAVARVARATLTDGLDVGVLGIDPETFEAAVYWDDSYADRPLGELIGRIAAEGSRLRALAVGAIPSDASIGAAGGDVPIDIVARAEFFPGKNSEDPLLVTTRATFDRLLADVGSSLSSREAELWAKGDADRVRSILQRRQTPFFTMATTERVLQTPALRSTLWTLGLLGALGAASGVAAVGGLLLYVQARHRSALMGAGLTRRMGLGRGPELRSWLVEIGTSLGLSYLLAVAVGLGVAGLMHERLDLRPSLPPEPILVVPIGGLLTAAVTGVVLVWVSAVRLQRDLDRANIAEILRT